MVLQEARLDRDMKNRRYFAALVLVGCLSGCTGSGDQQPSGVDLSASEPAAPTSSPPEENIGDIMARYKRSADCEGADYAAFNKTAGQIIDGTSNTPPGLIGLETGLRQSVARSMIDLAEDAVEKKCLKTARKTYLAVIDTFTGSAYAAARQRAQIGIDDLRAAQMQALSRNR